MPGADLSLSMTIAVGALVPSWLAVPMAATVMIAAAGHIASLQRSAIGHRRKSIRTAVAWLTLVTAPLLAIASSIATPDQPKLFVLSWLCVMVLVGVILVLALMDSLVTGREVRARLRVLRDQQRQLVRTACSRIIHDQTPSNQHGETSA